MKLDNKLISLLVIAPIVLSFSYMLLGVTGVKTIMAIFLVFLLPFYLILGKFGLETDERLIFSFFIGLGIFSLVVFYVNRVVPSFRSSTIITFSLMMAAGIYFSLMHKKRPEPIKQQAR